MEPTVPVGSLILSKPVSQYNVGDIITFKSVKEKDVKNPRLTTTHRIVSLEKISSGKIEYKTKGDANDAPDISTVPQELILGKMVFMVPYLGYPISLAKTQAGFIFLIVIPATLIIYSEILNIKNESKRLIQERRKRKLTKTEELEEKVGEEIQKVEDDLKSIVKPVKKGRKSVSKESK